MKRLLRYLYFLALLFLLGCADNSAQEIQKITPEQMHDAILEENVQILDVRPPEEFQAGKIKGAQNICYTHSNFKEKAKQLDKTKPVYLYCKTGGHSAKAAKILKEMGFKEIYDMNGGIKSWNEKGFEKDNF